MRFNYSKLRGLIKEKFETQEKFAKAMGMDMSTLSARLNNKTYFTSDEMFKACNLLGVPKVQIPFLFFVLD